MTEDEVRAVAIVGELERLEAAPPPDERGLYVGKVHDIPHWCKEVAKVYHHFRRGRLRAEDALVAVRILDSLLRGLEARAKGEEAAILEARLTSLERRAGVRRAG
jgi:hypothetical protein